LTVVKITYQNRIFIFL